MAELFHILILHTDLRIIIWNNIGIISNSRSRICDMFVV